ncbi:hypothetical protein IFJ82_14450 [Novacetimonas hansenii]|uniref:hypothetical protein n=1 Tax=Novacetimonas hansenii TaxID=436 RepID=UPI00178569B5|nr:hypothetical protein [Novacetimonas hansenii]QOF95003.1 hypothetical protein IFJ82_14450 [Novacetimonas hansenii]
MLKSYTRDIQVSLKQGEIDLIGEYLKSISCDGLLSTENDNKKHLLCVNIDDYIYTINKCRFRLLIYFNNNTIEKVKIDSLIDDVNEINLDKYIDDLLNNSLVYEAKLKLKTYFVRNYIKYYNSKSINASLFFNYFDNVIMTAVVSPPSPVPLSENILQFDIKVNAINIDQARSISYNLSKNICALLSVFLDINFEMINEESRFSLINLSNLVDRGELGGIVNIRSDLGYYDEELDICVLDNLNGMQSGEAFVSGERNQGNVSLTIDRSFLPDPELPDDIPDELREYFSTNPDTLHFTIGERDFLEKLFFDRCVPMPDERNINYSDKLSRDVHIKNTEINIPKDIKEYFSMLSVKNDLNECFLSCARIYNLALTNFRYEATAFASYLVCCVEIISQYNCSIGKKMSFSKAMEEYSGKTKDYDKKICDFFYGSVRSAHFHSGKFRFSEYNVSLMTATDFATQRNLKLIFQFYRMVRHVIIEFFEQEFISRKT